MLKNYFEKWLVQYCLLCLRQSPRSHKKHFRVPLTWTSYLKCSKQENLPDQLCELMILHRKSKDKKVNGWVKADVLISTCSQCRDYYPFKQRLFTSALHDTFSFVMYCKSCCLLHALKLLTLRTLHIKCVLRISTTVFSLVYSSVLTEKQCSPPAVCEN